MLFQFLLRKTVCFARIYIFAAAYFGTEIGFIMSCPLHHFHNYYNHYKVHKTFHFNIYFKLFVFVWVGNPRHAFTNKLISRVSLRKKELFSKTFIHRFYQFTHYRSDSLFEYNLLYGRICQNITWSGSYLRGHIADCTAEPEADANNW